MRNLVQNNKQWNEEISSICKKLYLILLLNYRSKVLYELGWWSRILAKQILVCDDAITMYRITLPTGKRLNKLMIRLYETKITYDEVSLIACKSW